VRYLILALLLSACASRNTASSWTAPAPANHPGPQCIDGQQQLGACP
jgi:hypothetical protein